MPTPKVRCSARNGRFSSSLWRSRPHDSHQEGRCRYARAFRSLRLAFVALLLTHPRFRSRFSHLRAPKKRPSAPISVLLIDASSTWTWWIKPKLRRGSQVRFLLLPGVRCDWPARQVHVPQVDGGRGRHLPRPLCCSRHERGHLCDVPEGRTMRAGW